MNPGDTVSFHHGVLPNAVNIDARGAVLGVSSPGAFRETFDYLSSP
jgi:hypothetical protein